jgi:type II secretory pathway component PulJ
MNASNLKLKTRNLKHSFSGFILIEMLVAASLFALVATGLSTGFVQGVKAHQRIEESFKAYDPLRLLFLRLDRDLRNAIILEDYPFKGKKDEIEFPALLTEEKDLPAGKAGKRLHLIRYFVKDHALIRSEEELTLKLTKPKPQEKTLVKGLGSFELQFPYLDDEEALVFHPFWLDEPYYGIPRAVTVKLEREKETLEKLISIPQGRTGRIPHE